ncbi:MAG: site-specific integrase [Desulfobacteraceae bacterium]|nr:site-specific integrase [Desulfobacteraceae bacterium]
MTNAVRTLTEDEAHKLLQYLKNDHRTQRQQRLCVRNYVMACIMLEAGLRVGEVTQLKVSHLWFIDRPVTNLIVSADIAKNHKQREIPVSCYLRNAIEFLQQDFWSTADPLSITNAFCYAENKLHLTTRQVERILQSAGMKSLNRPVNPHLLRHTFATRLSRVTNIRIVQLLLGHNNLSSTQIYTHPNSDDLQAAIKAVENGKPDTKSAAMHNNESLNTFILPD